MEMVHLRTICRQWYPSLARASSGFVSKLVTLCWREHCSFTLHTCVHVKGYRWEIHEQSHSNGGTEFRTDVAIAFSSTCLPAPVFFLLLVHWFKLYSKAQDGPVLEENLNETMARKRSHDESSTMGIDRTLLHTQWHLCANKKTLSERRGRVT
jgi:hypothetical protein